MAVNLRSIQKKLNRQPEWIGKDGMAVCMANSKKAALRKFTELWYQAMGDEDCPYTLEDVDVAYLHHSNEPDQEWCVWRNAPNPYQVFILVV